MPKAEFSKRGIMSREYYFYPAIKRDDGYYPALLERDWDKNELHPSSCYFTNADFISDEDKEKLEWNRIDPRQMKGEFIKWFTLDERSGDEFDPMFVYELSKKFIEKHSGSGLVVGYMPTDTVVEASKNDIPLVEYKDELIKPEIYAENPHKDEFMRVSFVDYQSLEHICGLLNETLWNLNYYNNDVCMLAYYSY